MDYWYFWIVYLFVVELRRLLFFVVKFGFCREGKCLVRVLLMYFGLKKFVFVDYDGFCLLEVIFINCYLGVCFIIFFGFVL